MVNTNQTEHQNPCKVLLIDDSSDVASLIRAHLSDPRISLTVSNNGREGIEAFINGSFDFVLMDLQMPEMDGYEATRQIRLWERQNNLRPTPIAALTASSSPADISEMFISGCSHYLPKPITRNVLLQTVGQYFAASRKDLSAPAASLASLEKATRNPVAKTAVPNARNSRQP